jgi:hypothetical protein
MSRMWARRDGKSEATVSRGSRETGRYEWLGDVGETWWCQPFPPPPGAAGTVASEEMTWIAGLPASEAPGAPKRADDAVYGFVSSSRPPRRTSSQKRRTRSPQRPPP